jgi:hypothetical protein
MEAGCAQEINLKDPRTQLSQRAVVAEQLPTPEHLAKGVNVVLESLPSH